MWYPLSLGTFSSAAFNIVGCTVKGCFAQLLGCGAQAHTTRHGRGGRRRQRTCALRGRPTLRLHTWALSCAVCTSPNPHRCRFSWPRTRPLPSTPSITTAMYACGAMGTLRGCGGSGAGHVEVYVVPRRSAVLWKVAGFATVESRPRRRPARGGSPRLGTVAGVMRSGSVR